jgi:hypothetical protein
MATLPGQLVRNHVSPMRGLSRWIILIVQSFRSPKIRPGPWTSLRIHFVRCGIKPYLPLAVCLNLNLRQGGNVLGNGTWVNVGGNQAITYGGATAMSQNGGPPYNDPDGGQS